MKKKLIIIAHFLFFTTVIFSQVKSNGTWRVQGETNIINVKNDPDGGDGVSDGAVFIDGTSEESGQGVIFTCVGKMEANKTYSLNSYIFNTGNSAVKLKVSLYNATNKTVLVSSNEILLQKKVEGKDYNPEKLVTLSYISKPEDSGAILELRYIRTDDGNVSRNFAIDNITLNGELLPLPFIEKK